MRRFGFSTGALAKGDFRSAIEMLQTYSSSDAIELSALRYNDFKDILESLSSLDLSRFSYKSFHAPTDFNDEIKLIADLETVANQGFNIVVHPDVIQNFDGWNSLGSRLLIENMDSRKRTGRSCFELLHFFDKLPDAMLCFDIGHARQVDSSMIEARKILQEFGNRLCQIHMSEVDSIGIHHRMSWLSKESFTRVLSGCPIVVPIILESVVKADEIEDEIKSARSIFSQVV